MTEFSARIVSDEMLSPCKWMIFEEPCGKVTIAFAWSASEDMEACSDAVRAYRQLRARRAAARVA